MDILTITSKAIRTGALETILSEYYELKRISENNPWHINQNVFDHVVGVFQGLEKILEFGLLPISLRQKTEKYLTSKVGKHTRKEILIVATILHDIAKSKTLIRNDQNGTTRCPGHEMIGSFMAQEMGKRFGFSGTSLTHLQRIILYHGFVHDILDLVLENGFSASYLRLFRDVTIGFTVELGLLAYADMLGSDLPNINPQEFAQRENLLKKILRISLHVNRT